MAWQVGVETGSTSAELFELLRLDRTIVGILMSIEIYKELTTVMLYTTAPAM